MHNKEVQQVLVDCENDLVQAKTIVASIGFTSNIVPYLTKYAIIKACGAIEVAYKAIVADFCSKRSKIQIKRYLDNKVREGSRNPTYSNLCKLLAEFDEEWNKIYKEKINAHSDKDNILFSLQSLVDARNDFAHGGNPTITLDDTIKHFSYCRVAVEIMDDIIK